MARTWLGRVWARVSCDHGDIIERGIGTTSVIGNVSGQSTIKDPASPDTTLQITYYTITTLSPCWSPLVSSHLKTTPISLDFDEADIP
jgi:hypothetical protein